MRKKEIEAFVCWTDGTWTTELIAVDYEDEMDDCELGQNTTLAIVRKYLDGAASGGRHVAFAGVYHIPEDDESVVPAASTERDRN